MTRYKLTLEYNGRDLIGWQANRQGPSVQSVLTEAVYKFSNQNVDVVAAGRTDAGVHATGMVAHFDLDATHDGDTVMRALNFYLSNQPVTVLKCEIMPDDFHARFSCVRRNYKYVILNRRAPAVLDRDMVWWVPRELDIGKMRDAACHFIGNHDFTSFRASECQSKSPIKTLDKFEIEVVPATSGQYIIMNISAKSFLHHQVRNMVGTLVEIGLGKDYDIPKILGVKKRSAAGVTAPAGGLYFVSAEY